MIIPAKKLAALVEAQREEPMLVGGQFGGPLAPIAQSTSWSCGAAALANACAELGLDVSEEEFIELAGTNPEGTDDEGMLRACQAVGLTPEPMATDDAAAAWEWLIMYVAHGFPALICIDGWDHWIVVTGTDGENVLILDSEISRDNIDRNGVQSFNEVDMLIRWLKMVDGKPEFHAIAVSRSENAAP